MKHRFFTLAMTFVCAFVSVSCLTTKLSKDIELDGNGISEFLVEPSYVIHPMRIDILRNTYLESRSDEYGVSYFETEMPYAILCVSLGNGLYIDVNNNLFMDAGYWFDVNDNDVIEMESKGLAYQRNGNIINIISKFGFLTGKDTFIEDDGGIIEVKGNNKVKMIEKEQDGYKRIAVAVLTNMRYVVEDLQKKPDNSVVCGGRDGDLKIVQKNRNNILSTGKNQAIKLEIIAPGCIYVEASSRRIKSGGHLTVRINDNKILIKKGTKRGGTEVTKEANRIAIFEEMASPGLLPLLLGEDKSTKYIKIKKSF